jgi:hypothetical protein
MQKRICQLLIQLLFLLYASIFLYFNLDHKVKVHQIDASLDGGFMLQRANYLKEHQNEDIHVLVSNNTVMVAVNSKSVRDITAQNVSSTFRFTGDRKWYT